MRIRLRARLKAFLGWNDPAPCWPALVSLLKRYLLWSRTKRFDVELRYRPVAQFLKHNMARLGPNPRILDAGSGPLGLAHHLGRECVGVDVAFPPQAPAIGAERLERVMGSITELPFRDRSFDLVTSMDTLEHLTPENRPAAVRELFRVACKTVILGAPYGSRASEDDRKAQVVERALGVEPDWRREHVANGLPGPELDTLVASLASARGATRVRIRPHEGLLGHRLRWKLGLTIPQSHPAYGLVMAPLYAAANRFHVGPCYRRIYYAEFG